jgi:hypothetical protein
VGATTAVVMFADTSPVDVLRACPPLDRAATRVLVERLFPDEKVDEVGDALLVDAINPPPDLVYVGCFAGLDIVCGWQLVSDHPADLEPRLLGGSDRPHVYVHGMHADVQWTGYALWSDGELLRSLSACADPGVIEDIGEQLPFEQKYWDGDQGPLELGEEALHAFAGFTTDGTHSIDDVDPEIIPLIGYRVGCGGPTGT